MSATPIVTISCFSRTFMRWNGISAAELYLTSRPANSGMASRWAIKFGDRRLAAGDRAVDALAGEQQRALDAAAAAEGGKRRAQLFAAVEPHEAVERRDAEGLGGCG